MSAVGTIEIWGTDKTKKTNVLVLLCKLLDIYLSSWFVLTDNKQVKNKNKYFHLGRENQDGKNILIYFLGRNIWIDNTITSLLIISLDTGLYISDTRLPSCQGDTSSCTRPCRLCSTCTGRRCRHPCKENKDMKWFYFNSLFVPILSWYVLRSISL